LFFPERWAKVYDHWMTGIQDWCISRQLWWGHRIPVWSKILTFDQLNVLQKQSTSMRTNDEDEVIGFTASLSGCDGAESFIRSHTIGETETAMVFVASESIAEAEKLIELGFSQDP